MYSNSVPIITSFFFPQKMEERIAYHQDRNNHGITPFTIHYNNGQKAFLFLQRVERSIILKFTVHPQNTKNQIIFSKSKHSYKPNCPINHERKVITYGGLSCQLERFFTSTGYHELTLHKTPHPQQASNNAQQFRAMHIEFWNTLYHRHTSMAARNKPCENTQQLIEKMFSDSRNHLEINKNRLSDDHSTTIKNLDELELYTYKDMVLENFWHYDHQVKESLLANRNIGDNKVFNHQFYEL